MKNVTKDTHNCSVLMPDTHNCSVLMPDTHNCSVLMPDTHNCSQLDLLKQLRLFLIMAISCFCSSCISLDNGVDNSVEFAKTIWGSSTRALENARDTAITKTYDKSYWDCVRSALAVVKKKDWVIFKKDEIKGYMVVMGVKGCVNTTEIGIFFDELSDTQTRIEISSLSTNAKRKVAKGLFHGLDIAFGYLPPDPPELKEPLKTDQNVTTPAP